MAKNRQFKKTYLIDCEGVTTNDFMSKVVDDILRTTVVALDMQYKQLKIRIKEIK
jgi:hypothetical protein